MIANALANLFSALSFDGNNPRDPAIAKMLGLGNKATSGVDVTPEKVMALPAILRAINIISNCNMKLPWYVFREEQDGREWDKTHPAWDCVTRKPNPNFTIGPWKKTAVAHAMAYGNHVSAIYAPNWPKGPIELLPLDPKETRLVRKKGGGFDTNTESDGQLMYSTKIGQETRLLEPDRVIHIRGFGANPYWGYDIFDMLTETFGGAIAMDEFGHRFFGQGANPAGFVEMPAGLDEESEERFIDSLHKAATGLGKQHRFILLEDGAKFHAVTVDPEKSQLLETKQFNVRMLAMAIGIKVHKLIDGANSAFASLEQVNQEHKDDDIMPWVSAIREEFNDKLLTDQQKESGSHCIDVDDELLEWVPFKDRAEGLSKIYNDGLVTKEEGRRKLNFGPSRSPYGDRYRIPANIFWEGEEQRGTNQQTDKPEQDDTEDATDDSLKEVATAWLDNYRRRITKTADGKARQGAKAFLNWTDTLSVEKSPKPLQPSMRAIYTDVHGMLSNCLLTAKDDAELLVAVTDVIRSVEMLDLETYIGGLK